MYLVNYYIVTITYIVKVIVPHVCVFQQQNTDYVLLY